MYSRRVAALTGILFLCAGSGALKAQDSSARDSTTMDTVVAKEAPWYNHRNGPEDDSLVSRRLPANDVPDLRKQDDFWYVPVGPHPSKVQPQKGPNLLRKLVLQLSTLLGKPWFVFMLWTLAAGAVLAAIVLFLQASGGGRWSRRVRRVPSIQHEAGEARLDLPNLHEFLRAALDNADYTAAVRYLFLLTLHQMAERRLIRPGPGTTNRDYALQMSGHPLYTDFSRLVLRYEYTFYGGFVPTAASFLAIREQYEQFQQRLDVL